ncbi:MAG: pilus assembly protein PilP [Nitrospira sp.]|nr:pilus assembly protein PilP [Nitrospira sp.]
MVALLCGPAFADAQPAPVQSDHGATVAPAPPGVAQGEASYSYDPSGRRDPFKPIGLEKPASEGNLDLPPLQRIGLTEVSLIAIIWGGYGYSAMVQTPDGKGYTVKQGTRIGPNNGVISRITENSLVVEERFTDVYGNKQVREYVKRLHAKEGSE